MYVRGKLSSVPAHTKPLFASRALELPYPSESLQKFCSSLLLPGFPLIAMPLLSSLTKVKISN